MFSNYHLKYFVDAATAQSVSEAARVNRVSSSAISQAIRSLESHFEMSLLDHAKKRFILTPEGRHLLKGATNLLRSVDSLELDMKNARGAIQGEIFLGTQHSIAQHLLPEFLAATREKYPALMPNIHIGTTDVVDRWARERAVDFSISVDNLAHTTLAKDNIYSGQFLFVARKDHNTPFERSLFILPGESTNESQMFLSKFSKIYGRSPDVRMHLKSWSINMRLAESGYGVSLIPDFIHICAGSSKLKVLESKIPKIPCDICVFHDPKKWALSRQSRVFLEDFKAHVTERMGAATKKSRPPKKDTKTQKRP